MADLDPFVVQWPSKWIQDPEIGPVITYLNRFLHDLFIVTTAGTGSSVIEDAVVAEKYPWPINSSFEELDTISYPVIQQEQKVFRAVTVTQSYTAVSHDFINAKQNITVTFPQYPDENSVIIVRNGDNSSIKLSGNGKNINGSSTGTLARKGTSIEFYYFLDSDEWFAK